MVFREFMNLRLTRLDTSVNKTQIFKVRRLIYYSNISILVIFLLLYYNSLIYKTVTFLSITWNSLVTLFILETH